MPSKVEENLPPTNEGYGTHEYWEQRYTNEAPGTSFDWFLSPTYLLPLLEELTAELGKMTRILMLGCGNSTLSEVMYNNGWKRIVNLDYSRVVIDQMKERHSDKPEMEWLEMDVLDIKLPDDGFDVVIDKGTMDAMLTTKGDPWGMIKLPYWHSGTLLGTLGKGTCLTLQNPPEKDIITCNQEVTEAIRVLKKAKGSKFVYFTFGQPHFRKRYMANRAGWKLTHREIGPEEGFAYFMYVLEWEGEDLVKDS